MNIVKRTSFNVQEIVYRLFLYEWIVPLPEFASQLSITCLEHTGIYNALILHQLSALSSS
ncbi:MAG: hypothetical protein ACK4S0_08080 [Sediminibacterium sp.]